MPLSTGGGLDRNLDLNWNRIVPGTIRAILRDQRLVIRTDGNYVRDYLYVEDGVAASILLAERLNAQPELRGDAFNFSNESQVTVSQLVDKILKSMGSDLRAEIRDEANDEIRQQYLNASKAGRLLGWSQRFDLDSGLQKTIAWYRELFSNDGRGR
jgi:CDP-glucose 4,6-dehydratase